MYQAEVLGKLPVVQHFLFGSILSYEGEEAPEADDNDEHWGHNHAEGNRDFGWGDCCGIPVPSAFAAAKAANGGRLALGGGVRPVPFD